MKNSIEEITFVKNEIKDTRILFEEVGSYTFFDEDLCKAIEHILSDYKRILKENEELLEVKVSASAHNRILELEKEKSKYEWIRQNCLPQKLVNKLYIPIQKIKDKIRHYQELQDNYIKKYDEINEGLQAMINVLQELIEEGEEK